MASGNYGSGDLKKPFHMNVWCKTKLGWVTPEEITENGSKTIKNIEENAVSPSFIVVRELYGRLSLYHIDLYRLEHIAEIAELGLDDYIYGNGVCVVEWAEKALSLLPIEHLRIQISYLSDDKRSFQLKPNGKRYREILAQLKHLSLNS